jgi:hypothetical protein
LHFFTTKDNCFAKKNEEEQLGKGSGIRRQGSGVRGQKMHRIMSLGRALGTRGFLRERQFIGWAEKS